MLKRAIPSALALVLAAAGCDSEHNQHFPDGGDAAEAAEADAADATPDADADADAPADADAEAPPVPEESCAVADGARVEGRLLFDGAVPAGARLWVTWQLDPPRIPQCMLELEPFFPAPFRFTGVQRTGWHVEAVLDVSGGFPPIPAAGDFVATVPESRLDLSSDVSGLDITLVPYAE